MKRLFANIALLTVSLLACEAVLRIAEASSRSVHGLLMPLAEQNAPTRPGPDGYPVGNPYHPEHDEAGYRNAARPQQADLVVLGDSQAYGAGVAREAAWPSLLGGYNMALPGYGPGHGLLQIDEALALEPRVVILAVYFGNDFADTFWLGERRPDLTAGIDPELLRSAAAAAQREPIVSQERVIIRGDTTKPGRLAVLGMRTADHVKLAGLTRAFWERLTAPSVSPLLSGDFELATAAMTARQRKYALPVDEDGWRAILAPDYRGRVVDGTDPRIRLGFEASMNAISAIRDRLNDSHARLLVVLIPTKESVFWPRGRSSEELRQLVADESSLREELESVLQARRIACVDLLPVLRDATVQPYFEDLDGHPNEAGHRLIAERVSTYLARDESLRVHSGAAAGGSDGY